MAFVQQWAGGPLLHLVEDYRPTAEAKGLGLSETKILSTQELAKLVKEVQQDTYDDGQFIKYLSDALDHENEASLSDGLFLLFKYIAKHGLAAEQSLSDEDPHAWAKALEHVRTKKGESFVSNLLKGLGFSLEQGAKQEDLREHEAPGLSPYKVYIEPAPEKGKDGRYLDNTVEGWYEGYRVGISRHGIFFWLSGDHETKKLYATPGALLMKKQPRVFQDPEKAYQAAIECLHGDGIEEGPLDVIMADEDRWKILARTTLSDPQTLETLSFEEVDEDTY